MDFHSFDESEPISEKAFDNIIAANPGKKINLVDPDNKPGTTLKDLRAADKITLKDLGKDFSSADPGEISTDIVALAEKYGKEYRAIKAAEAAIKKRTEALAEQGATLFAMLENIGITSFKAGGRTYFTRVDMYASVDSENEVVAFKWVDDIGCDFLIAKKINAKSLTREIKAYVEAGGDMPGIKNGIKINTVNRFCAPRK